MPEKLHDQIYHIIQSSLPASCTIYVKSRKQGWAGSGFHIGNGVVITAAHVAPPEIAHGSEINITFDKKVFYSCSVYISDPNIDSAALKIQGDWSNIPSVTLANSDLVEVGEIVAVIGSPEMFHDTSTVGRVSNTHQSLGNSAPSPSWNDVIFVDADILMGVSGGMCVGTDGLVIGSVIGVTGQLADYGVGENVICPSSKIINMLKTNKKIV